MADTLTIRGEHVFYPIQNGSFETPEVGTDLKNYTTTFAGWTVTKGSVDILGAYQAADGDQSVDLNGWESGRIEQTFDTTEGAKYEVRFELSKNLGLNVNSQVATVEVSVGDESEVFTFSDNILFGDQKWAAHTFEFTADGASTTLSFESLTDWHYNQFGSLLDHVEVVRVLEDFDLSGGDVLDLRGLIPDAVVQQGQAFSNGWLEFDTSSGDHTDVLLDANGGNDYVPILTLVGTVLTESDTANYQL